MSDPWVYTEPDPQGLRRDGGAVVPPQFRVERPDAQGNRPPQYDPRYQRPAAAPRWQDDPWAASAGGQQEQWQRPLDRPGPQSSYQAHAEHLPYGPGTQPPWQPHGYQLPGALRRPGASRGVVAAVAAATLVGGIAIGYFIGSSGKSAPSAGTTAPQAATPQAAAAQTAAPQPETEAAVRSDATQFYALYSAGQWAQAWAMLTPAAQKEVSESTYASVHHGCPSASAGLARVIKSVTVAGSTAVVTETVAGALSSRGSVTDAWDYSGGRWGIALSASSLKDYSHSSAAADVAAMKAAGDCS